MSARPCRCPGNIRTNCAANSSGEHVNGTLGTWGRPFEPRKFRAALFLPDLRLCAFGHRQCAGVADTITRMRHSFVFLAVLAFVAAGFAQDKPYPLKGFTVGESTLQEFKTQFHHCADSCDAKAAKMYGSKFAPFCSDTESGAAVDAQGQYVEDVPALTQAGLVYCQPYFPFEEQHGPLFTIADTPATTRFDFFQDKLFRIAATFYATRFVAMQEALTGKYGTPTSVASMEYQNAFGAKYSGSIVTWDNGVSFITLSQYGGSLEYSSLVIEHKALAAQAAAARPKHSSNDL